MTTYVCSQLDESAQTCVAWTEQPSIPDWLPNVDQAQDVGFAVFASLVIIASMCLLFPRRESND